MKTMSMLALVGACALACGGAEKPPTLPTEAAPPVAAPAEGGEHHPPMAAEVHAFHEVLAPRWHSEVGPARKDTNCAAIAEFKTAGAAVQAASPGEGVDATAWTDAGTKLSASIGALEATCPGADVAAFDAAFHALHESFHAVMELGAGGMHKGQGGHEGAHEGHGEHHKEGAHQGHGGHQGKGANKGDGGHKEHGDKSHGGHEHAAPPVTP